METHLNLIEAVKATAGECNFKHGYSLEKLANFFRYNTNFAKFMTNPNKDHEIQIFKMFGRVSESLDFNVYLHRKVATHLKGKFTKDQLCCIFQAYNGVWVRYNDMVDIMIKDNLYDYIDFEGKKMYILGDVEEFKAKIEAIDPFEFEAFVNLILEAWNVTGEFSIGKLLDSLKSG
jgi:hypothetical protein